MPPEQSSERPAAPGTLPRQGANVPPDREGVALAARTRDPSAVSVEGLRPLGVRPPFGLYLRDFWVRRDLALSMPMGELKSRHMNSMLGSVWHLLNPLLLTAVYYLVFGVILNMRSRGGEEGSNYIAFLVIGIITFFYSQKAAMSGMKSIIGNLRLLQSLNFPRAVLPLTTVIAEAVAQLPALLVMMAFVVVTGEQPHLTWLLILPIALVQTLFNAGLALYSARLTYHFRDMEQLLPYLTRIWFYLSGILFAASRVPEGWMRTVFELNPAYVYVSLMREALLDGATPAGQWLAGLAWAAIILATGLLFFWQKETEYGRG